MLSSCMKCTCACTVKGQWTSLNIQLFRRYSVYTSSPTHYDVLEIGRQATPKEIKRAYITLCRKFHPDANPGDPGAQQKFVRLQEAYNVLSNATDRAKYDVQMYKDIRERAKTKQTASYTTTHSTENLSEQETIQRFYRQHQEQYEEWIRKARQDKNNNAGQDQTTRGQHHYSDPREWWGDLNPSDPHYEIKSKIFQYLSKLTAADIFLFTAFGKMASLFMMMFFLYFQWRKS